MRVAVIVVATMVLVGVFVLSGLNKARDTAGTAIAAIALGAPGSLARPIARILPVIELSLAAALLVGLALSHVRQAAAVAAIALLATFTFAMVRTLRRGQTPICQCFGSLGGRPIGVDSVVRNLALAALAAVVGLG